MGYKPLGECVERIIDHRGLTPKKLGGSWSESGYRALSAKNIKDGLLVQEDAMNLVSEEMYRQWMPEEVKRGDVFITSEAPFGEVLYWDSDEKLVLSQRVFGLTAKTGVCNSRYLYYWMRSPQFQGELRGRATGTTVIGLRQPELLKCQVNLLPLEQQTAIACLLGAIDGKIALNNQINGYLAELLDASYSLTTKNGTEVKTLPEVADILSGGTPKTGNSEYWEGGDISFFTPGDVTSSVYTLTTGKHVTEMGLANCNSSLYPINTVFLTARGTVGKVAIAGNPMAMNQSCFAFRGKGIPQSVVFQIIKNAVKSLKAKANGATFAAINARDLGIERVAIPSKDAMSAYDRNASVWLSEILANERESLQLADLRDALLPKLMSGEIDASKVDLMQLNSHLSDC